MKEIILNASPQIWKKIGYPISISTQTVENLWIDKSYSRFKVKLYSNKIGKVIVLFNLHHGSIFKI